MRGQSLNHLTKEPYSYVIITQYVLNVNVFSENIFEIQKNIKNYNNLHIFYEKHFTKIFLCGIIFIMEENLFSFVQYNKMSFFKAKGGENHDK